MFNDFQQGYIQAAFWTNEMDEAVIEDLTDATAASMVADCNRFERENADDLTIYCDLLSVDRATAGHDFWLTRNGHGAGFWDRDLGYAAEVRTQVKPVLERLTAASSAFGEFDIGINEGGKVST